MYNDDKQNLLNNVGFVGMNEVRSESPGAQKVRYAREHRICMRYRKMLAAIGFVMTLMTTVALMTTMVLMMPAVNFEQRIERADASDVKVAVKAPEGAFPEGATMEAKFIEADDVKSKVEEAVERENGAKAEITGLTAVDIIFKDKDGKEIEPAKKVEVKITSDDVRGFDNPALVHVLDKNSSQGNSHDAEVVSNVEIVNEEEGDKTVGVGDTMRFETAAFSPYVLIDHKLDEGTGDRTFTATDGSTYAITVNVPAEAGIPANATLLVQELLETNSDWDTYVDKVEGQFEGEVNYIRLFDIKIVDENDPTIEYQPAEGAAIEVNIELSDAESDDLNVVHFADSDDEGDVVDDVEVDDGFVNFETTGFSVYVIVDAPQPASIGWEKVTSLSELEERGASGVRVGQKSGYYFKNTLDGPDNKRRIGISKTKPASATPPSNSATYYFEKVPGTTDQFYAYCFSDSGEKQYVYNNGNNSLSFTTEDNKTAFTAAVNASGEFSFSHDGWYWNMQGSANGNRFCSWSENNDDSKMYVWYNEGVESDPYNLSGETYAFLVWDGGKTGKALSSIPNDEPFTSNLGAEFLSVMTKTDGNESDELYRLFVPNDTSSLLQSTNWKFEWSGDGDLYYLSSEMNDDQYLKIDSSGLSVTTNKSEALVKLVPGTGIHENQVCLKSADGNTTLTYSGKFDEGFNVSGSVGSEWLYLAKSKRESILNDGEYGKTYSAKMLSVSDAEGYQIAGNKYEPMDPDLVKNYSYILYTRVWNGHGYSYFALNGDGKLVPCVESGDSIEWIGGSLNDMVWQFTEYGSWDNENDGVWKPSGYYELFNESANNGDGAFLAPLATENQVFSSSATGVMLPGRDKGQYYSEILAWDDSGYAFTGLNVDFNDDEDEKDPTIEPCIRVDALDFYFAQMEEVSADDGLTSVDTVDNTWYGISMKLTDFSSRKDMSDYLGSNKGGLTTDLDQGLLSNYLEGDADSEDAYPVTMLTGSGGSLRDFFSDATSVNHLFLQSTYDSTGYFEYDSAQNFASLEGRTGGDFTVYKELASYDTSDRYTLKHGQFFPYNVINAGVFASVNGRNLYEPAADSKGNPVPLSNDNPRKNEQLYLINDVNCFFGMELTASFEQTPDGLDAWGHDIIFEFSGDDDFWLYVDGELIIDLGGIHSAVPGSVNFRTGEVNVNGDTSKNLRQYFESNYLSRHPQATEQEVADYLAKYFDEGSTVFKDGTHHTMRIFYLERGAGASNLHMRFNLAAVKKDTVQLTKELEGADVSESSLLMFPYQVMYTLEGDSESQMLTNSVPGTALTDDYVYYKDTDKAVDFRPNLVVDGVTYENVFLLKPGETAEINFPVVGTTGEERTVDTYQIIECGVDQSVYNEVSVKEDGVDVTEVSAGSSENPDLKNYAIDAATTSERPKVTYVNKTDAIKSLTIVKEVYNPKTLELINPYDDAGNVISGFEDSDILNTQFAFRLDFQTAFDDDFVPANMYIYHVKNPAGHYCSWDTENQKFVPIMHGGVPVDNYDDLTDDEKIAASFDTSMYGSITKIPAYYTVELRGLIPGMKYRVIERPTETPDGYEYYMYELNGSDAKVTDPWDGVQGSIDVSEDADVTVCNFKGYGLRVNKIWADEESTANRDSAYFAVFYEQDNELKLVNGSVKSLEFGADPQTLYWYYQELPEVNGVPYANVEFDNYVVREVTVDGEDVTPVADGDTIVLEGTPTGGRKQSLSYKVTYDDPTTIDDVDYDNPTHIGDNVNIFYATNTPDNRPAIKLQKSDWSGDPLSGAVFELKDEGGALIGTYTSSASGLIRVAYLDYGKSYTLTETQSPQGYVGLSQSLTITMPADAESPVTVTSDSSEVEGYYSLAQKTDEELATLTVKDRPYVFQAVKVNAKNPAETVAGAQFQLYKQVTVGDTLNWTVLEWDDAAVDDKSHPTILVSDGDGTIPHLDNELPAGTYQLHEYEAPGGYEKISVDIVFTVSQLGKITLGAHPENVALTPGSETDEMTYLLTIPNEPLSSILLEKVDESDNPMIGSQFRLESLNGEVQTVVPGYELIDMTTTTEAELEFLPVGRYCLAEIKAPDGYIIMTKYVYFTIDANRTVTLTDEAGTGQSDNDLATISGPDENGVYKITVKNLPGKALFSTGGIGTMPFTVGGLFLIAIAVCVYIFGFKRRQAR